MTAEAIASAEGTPSLVATEPELPPGLTEREARERRAKGLGNHLSVGSSRSYARIVPSVRGNASGAACRTSSPSS